MTMILTDQRRVFYFVLTIIIEILNLDMIVSVKLGFHLILIALIFSFNF